MEVEISTSMVEVSDIDIISALTSGRGKENIL